MVKLFDYLKHPIMLYIIKEHAYLYVKLGVTIGFGSTSSINGSDETLGCKSLLLSRVYLIKDGALRFFSCRTYRRSSKRSCPSDCELTHQIL